MDSKVLLQCMKYGDANQETIDELELMMKEYPWFSALDFLKTRIKMNSTSNEIRQEGAQRIPFLQNPRQFYKVLFNCVDFNNAIQNFNLGEEEVEIAEDSEDLIDIFLANRKPAAPKEKAGTDSIKGEEKKETDNECFTETLAKIYVSQGLYDKAISTYFRLSLKYPEKSSYFATQIEKIKPLIKL